MLLVPVVSGCGPGAPPGSPAALAAELQGLDIPHLALTDDMVIMKSGQVDEEQLTAMPRFGNTLVVCLRPATEGGTGWEEAVAKRHGIDFVRLSITGEAAVTRANAAALNKALGPTPRGALVYSADGELAAALLALRAHFDRGEPAAAAIELGRRLDLDRFEAATRSVLGF